jgi:Pyruvate/2-oxoacid:ferredoxin oxidoreductase delta subunit
MARPRIIVSLHDTPDALNAMEQTVIDQLRERGLNCLLIPHLCHISESSDIWSALAKPLENSVVLCWIHPRPAIWLLQRHQLAGHGTTILNLGSFPDAKAVIDAVLATIPTETKTTTLTTRQTGKIEKLTESTHPRWFPVLDASRCINCQHCLQFCLFGVYELDADGKVAVCHPDQCKPGCPACSRVCPQSAIMFPLYEKDAAIAGAPGKFVVLDADARKMFYTRTRQPCPECGQTADTKPRKTAKNKTTPCPECGRLRIAGAPPAHSHSPGFDDLDDLVDRLDQQMQRRR